MFLPLETAVKHRVIEQSLLQIKTDLFRMWQGMDIFASGYVPTSNNFPLPPDDGDDDDDDPCTTVCIDGTPTIPVGSVYAYRRLSILSDGAAAAVFLDYTESESAWISPAIPLTTPLVCSGQSVHLRWKMTATGIGVGDVTLVLQYQVPVIGPAWNDGPTWDNTGVWDTRCGLKFRGGEDFDAGLLCNQAAPTDICVNPVNLCDGDETACFFEDGRAFALTVSGISGGSDCTPFNRSWALAKSLVRTCVWEEVYSPDSVVWYRVAFGTSTATTLRLQFQRKVDLLGPPANWIGATILGNYDMFKCDAAVPGNLRLTRITTSLSCSGWPSTIDVTCT